MASLVQRIIERAKIQLSPAVVVGLDYASGLGGQRRKQGREMGRGFHRDGITMNAVYLGD